MIGPDQRRLLGAFVRAHRERMRPEGDAGRRRTPGLRREELAGRAGFSATWCAWIEQGRDVQASPRALARLAQALGLTRPERAYLFDLAGRRDPDVSPPEPTIDASAELQPIVDAILHPAYGLDPIWTACCWNGEAARLFPGWLGKGDERNLLRFVFLDAAARRLIPAWPERARRLIAEFRADYSQRFDDPRVVALVADLRRESPAFAAGWNEQDVLDRRGGLRSVAHPLDGLLHFHQHTFNPSSRPDYKLVVLIPAALSAETADRRFGEALLL